MKPNIRIVARTSAPSLPAFSTSRVLFDATQPRSMSDSDVNAISQSRRPFARGLLPRPSDRYPAPPSRADEAAYLEMIADEADKAREADAEAAEARLQAIRDFNSHLEERAEWASQQDMMARGLVGL